MFINFGMGNDPSSILMEQIHTMCENHPECKDCDGYIQNQQLGQVMCQRGFEKLNKGGNADGSQV